MRPIPIVIGSNFGNFCQKLVMQSIPMVIAPNFGKFYQKLVTRPIPIVISVSPFNAKHILSERPQDIFIIS